MKQGGVRTRSDPPMKIGSLNDLGVVRRAEGRAKKREIVITDHAKVNPQKSEFVAWLRHRGALQRGGLRRAS
jgi:hypothetical protein